MRSAATLSNAEAVLPLRTRFRQEMNCQIVHDSLYRRNGWTLTYLLECQGIPAGFGSIAVAGPWKDKPTIFEFYLLPEYRNHGFEFFEAFLQESGARFFEVQSNDVLLTVMLHTYGREIQSEKIVFADHSITRHPAPGATLVQQTPQADFVAAQSCRQGGGEWLLHVNGTIAGKGGVLFHYNQPYGDIYMEIFEPFRNRGYGTYVVQELKRICYECEARCNPGNIASRKTLQKAGFVPFAHILLGSV